MHETHAQPSFQAPNTSQHIPESLVLVASSFGVTRDHYGSGQAVVSIVTDDKKNVKYTSFETQKMIEILTMMTEDWEDE